MELARSKLTAASAPTTLWDYAIEHAVDVLNRTIYRTSGPSRCRASYKILNGVKPSIMPMIMPFGSNRACSSAFTPGALPICREAYSLWIPASRIVVNTSDVYFDETRFPCPLLGHSASSPAQRDAPLVASPNDENGKQPLGLPAAATLASLKAKATPRRVLLLFSGPFCRSEGFDDLIRADKVSVRSSDYCWRPAPTANIKSSPPRRRVPPSRSLVTSTQHWPSTAAHLNSEPAAIAPAYEPCPTRIFQSSISRTRSSAAPA
eukprot:6205971-Pleurochrysis_carterae.AAC.1